jgi:serine/threonine-protein kinase OSR1/STK39
MCNNEYIASFYTSFLCGKHVWLVMPIYEGGSIADIVRARFPKGISNIGIIANILLNVLRALEYLHKQGQIHRDIKCSNIFISLDGKLYLGDFGICGILKEGTAFTFAGTLCWMAPDVLQAEHGYDCRADIWSVGITAIELAQGKAPYDGLTAIKVIH